MVYGVFGGCYSDWFVIGYFDNKDKAEDFCFRANKNVRFDYEELYVRELPNLECESKEKRIGVSVDTEDWSVEISPFADEDVIIDYGDCATIVMMIYPSQYDKAEKIAQDRWAQYRAEKAGIV